MYFPKVKDFERDEKGDIIVSSLRGPERAEAREQLAREHLIAGAEVCSALACHICILRMCLRVGSISRICLAVFGRRLNFVSCSPCWRMPAPHCGSDVA